MSDYRISERPSTSWSAVQCSRAPITAEIVPFSSVLEVMWSALQGQQHYTHISAEFLEVLAALHRSSGEIHNYDVCPLKNHEMVQLFCSFYIFFIIIILTDSRFCKTLC